MLEDSKAYCSFSVNDLKKAKEFYGDTLGLKVEDFKQPGCDDMLKLSLGGGAEVLVYPKADHVPATFTILNFPVGNITDEVKALAGKGIKFEKYENTDNDGINHDDGPLIAWFKDPAGNFLSVIEEEGLEAKDNIKNQPTDFSGNEDLFLS